MTRLLAVLVAWLWALPAAAHDTGTPRTEAPGLTIDPAILAPLLASAGLFVFGWRRLHERSGRGSSALIRRARLFAAGWIVLAFALVSPLHEAGERSFAAHMFEHELIMLAAAPMLVLSASRRSGFPRLRTSSLPGC